MEGLTAKVFRTYNASITLQEQLRVLTRGEWVLTPDPGGHPHCPLWELPMGWLHLGLP